LLFSNQSRLRILSALVCSRALTKERNDDRPEENDETPHKKRICIAIAAARWRLPMVEARHDGYREAPRLIARAYGIENQLC